MFEIDTPFKKLKMDELLACAKYIREYIPEQRRGDRPLNDWANETFKQHTQITRRMVQINPTWTSPNETDTTRLARSILQMNLRQQIANLQSTRVRKNGPSNNQKWIKHKKKKRNLAVVPVFFPKIPKEPVYCPPPPRSRKLEECLPVVRGCYDSTCPLFGRKVT